MRGAPQTGLIAAIFLIRVRILGLVSGRPLVCYCNSRSRRAESPAMPGHHHLRRFAGCFALDLYDSPRICEKSVSGKYVRLTGRPLISPRT